MNTTPIKEGASPLTPDQRLVQARVVYAQMKTHMFMAILFGICGLFVFGILYDRYIAADPWTAFKNISTMGMVVMPFIPALIFTFFYRKQEKRYLELIRPE